MLLENYGTVMQLQVLKQFENCNILFLLCLLIHKSQFDVCLFVFLFACFPACFFVYTHYLTDNTNHHMVSMNYLMSHVHTLVYGT
jgi:uncharacterized membrane protein